MGLRLVTSTENNVVGTGSVTVEKLDETVSE